MNRKNVLIITYYWPPSGGPGVQRWLKFAKYLPKFGWNPIIYTPDKPGFYLKDPSLLKEVPSEIEVWKQAIWEPNILVKFLSKKSSGKGFDESGQRRGALGKLLLWLRANLFIPDSRVAWVAPSIRYLVRKVKNTDIQIIITTGPPHSMHLIGMGLSKATGIPWIADFRDPWVGFFQNEQLPLTAKTKRKHAGLEKEVLQKAHSVTTVSSHIAKSLSQFNKQVKIIPNGFDRKVSTSAQWDEQFTITYVGMMKEIQNPEVLWTALIDLCVQNADFDKSLKIRFVGEVDPSIRWNLENSILSDKVEYLGYKNYEELAMFMDSAQILLLCLLKGYDSKGVLTGKVFEYLAASRPILAIGDSTGDLAALMEDTKAGRIFEFTDGIGVRNFLCESFDRYCQNDLNISPKNILRFHRESLTEELVKLLNSIA